jgi:hypothetical protein
MSPETQNLVKELVTEFEGGVVYDFGISAPSEKVEFSFKYNGKVPIQCVQASCGCTDLRVEDGNVIKGTLSLGTNTSYSKHQSAHVLDEEDRIWVVQGKVAVPTQDGLKPVPLDRLKSKPLPIEQKTFTVYFDDGQDFKVVDDKKVVRENENKAKTSLLIKGYIKL